MNRWIADRGYGTGMALAFEGDKDFIRRSINFAVNFLGCDDYNIRHHSPRFVVINTTMERLEAALYQEAYLAALLELAKSEPLDNPLLAMENEDFGEDFNERCEKFRADLWAAANSDEVAVVLERDPTKRIFEPGNPPEREAKANEIARNKTAEQLSALVFEDFMRGFSPFGLHTHEVAETA